MNEFIANAYHYIALGAGWFILIVIGVALAAYSYGQVDSAACRRREKLLLQRALSECFEIDRWCADDPKISATAQRIIQAISTIGEFNIAYGEIHGRERIDDWRERVMGGGK